MINRIDKDKEIIKRLRKLKEKYYNYEGVIPAQYLNIVTFHREVLERNGLLDEFNLKGDNHLPLTNVNSIRRETILNSEPKIQRTQKETIPKSNTKTTSPNRDQEIIERLRKLKEKYYNYEGVIPTQYLNLVTFHREVLERNGLLEEFNLKGDNHLPLTNVNGISRETFLNSEPKIQRTQKEIIPKSNTKTTSPNRDQKIIERLRKLKEKYYNYEGVIPTQYLNIVTFHREVLERNGLLEEFNLKGDNHLPLTNVNNVQRETILNSELKATSSNKYYMSNTAFVRSHIRRNRNGTTSIVRAYTRKL